MHRGMGMAWTSADCDQALRPQAATRSGGPPAAARAAAPRGGRADAGVGAGRVRQDHAARRVARRGSRPTTGAVAWLSLDARDHRPATFWTYVVTALQAAVPGRRRRRAPAAAVAPSRRPRPCSPRCSTSSRRTPDEVWLVLDDYHLVDGPDLRRGHDLPAGAPPAARASRDQQPRRPAPAAGPAGGPAASWSRSAPPTCASPPTKPPPTSTTSPGWTSPPDDIAALEGRTEGWIAALQLAALSHAGTRRTSADSSPSSPGTTGTSSTTSSRRC